MKPPVIGVTLSVRGSWIAWVMISLSIRLSGGKPIRINANKPQYDKTIQGLIISGGKDVHPDFYSGEMKPFYPYEKNRDDLELKWFSICEEKGLPVLGICRGSQLMNVARKGTLFYDVRKAYQNPGYPIGFWGKIFFRKEIKIYKDSLLYSILKSEKTRINSSHLQSINVLGDNLIITALEKNRVVQAIEDPKRRFFLGVQFHPEFLIYSKMYLNIFKELIIAAKKIT